MLYLGISKSACFVLGMGKQLEYDDQDDDSRFDKDDEVHQANLDAQNDPDY